MNISLESLDKAEVLAALYNAAKPQGMGFLHYSPTPMTATEAAALINRMLEARGMGPVVRIA